MDDGCCCVVTNEYSASCFNFLRRLLLCDGFLDLLISDESSDPSGAIKVARLFANIFCDLFIIYSQTVLACYAAIFFSFTSEFDQA